MLSQYLTTIHSILSKESVASGLILFRVEEPYNTRKHQMGKFIVLRVHKDDRYIPINIAGSDLDNEEIPITIQGIIRVINMFNLPGIYRNTREK